ncbi:MAG: hypothetical protein IT534_02860 [Bauldia sp.]|nr:hypothetical protein [Bauldia sp.]
MKRLVALAAGVAMLPLVAHAQVPAPDPQAVALRDCLVTNSTTVEEGMFRNMLIALLQQDGVVAQTYLIGIFAQIQTIGAASCGVTADVQAAPWASNVPADYINAMLGRTVSNALQFLQTAAQQDAAPAAPAGGAAAPAFQVAP